MLTNIQRVEIKKALEGTSALPWRVGTASPNGLQNVGTKMGVMVCQTFTKEDAHLIANAPTWLKQQDEMIEQLLAEVSKCREESMNERELSETIVAERETLIIDNEQMKAALAIAVEALEWYASDECAQKVQKFYFGLSRFERLGEEAMKALDRIQSQV